MTAIGLRDGSRVIAGVLFSALVTGLFCGGVVGGHLRPRAPARNAARSSAGFRAVPTEYSRALPPGAARSFLVLAPGTLDNGEWSTVFRTSCDGRPDSTPTSVRYASAGVPVVAIERQQTGVRFELSFALVPDPALLLHPAASVLIMAWNTDQRAHLVGVSTGFFTGRERLGYVADVQENAHIEPRWASRDGGKPAHGWVAPVLREPLQGQWSLAPGESVGFRYIIPAYAESESTLRRLGQLSHRAVVQRAGLRWSATLDTGVVLGIPDPAVADAFRSAVSVLLGCTQTREGREIPIGNPLQYRDVWLRDGSRCAASLAMAGHIGLARQIVLGFLAYQWPQGPFLSQRGQLDGTGHVLWAMGQTHLRPSPSNDLRELADAGMAAWRWAEAQRASTQLLNMPFGGLLPPSEPRDNELRNGSGQIVGVDAWTIAGYEALGRLLEAEGQTARATAVRLSRARYLARFRQALEAVGTAGVPPAAGSEPARTRVLRWPTPASPLSTRPEGGFHARKRLEGKPCRRARSIWCPRHGPHVPVRRCGETELLRGHPQRSQATLRALVRWRTASGGSPELFAANSMSFGQNFPPHATAAAGIVALVRNMLVFDDDDTLRLTLGAPAPWWRKIAVRRAPSRWGDLALDFDRRGNRFSWRWTPVPVPTELCLPAGYRAARGTPEVVVRIRRMRSNPPAALRLQLLVTATIISTPMTTPFWLYPLQRTIGLALPCAALLASAPGLG